MTEHQRQADVIIVGAGPAGIAAALEASARGASFIGIDLDADPGGTARFAGGGCCLAFTSTQRREGIDDSAERLLEDLLHAAEGEAHESWARFYVMHCAREVHDWVVERGVVFSRVRWENELAELQSRPRWHEPVGAGHGLMQALWTALGPAGQASWRFGVSADELIREGGRVVGVRARARDGAIHELRARAVVLATGGFMSNLELVRTNMPPMLAHAPQVLAGGGPAALGDGHRMASELGAAVAHMNNLWFYLATPDYRAEQKGRGIVIRDIADSIWVIRSGRRFHDERLVGGGSAIPALAGVGEAGCWAILDRAAIEKISIYDPYFRPSGVTLPERREELLARSPHVALGATIGELAQRSGIDAAGLEETMASWSLLLGSGKTHDPATGRSLADTAPLSKPPFYAVRLLPLARKNLGGVRTDLRGRVLDDQERPIAGLFGAGELTGFGGGHMGGKRALEGIMIGASIFTGRVAGSWAAHAAGENFPDGLNASDASARDAHASSTR